MGDSNLSYDDLLKIVELVQSSPDFNEFHLKYGDIEVDLRKQGAGAASAGQPAPPVVERAPAPSSPQSAPAKEKTPANAEVVPALAAAAAADALPPGAKIIKSPMVGTFYAAPEPGGKPFITVGQRVEPDTTVCIIEVMKLMNTIRADHAGVITHILMKDGEPVEFGQALIAIDPK